MTATSLGGEPSLEGGVTRGTERPVTWWSEFDLPPPRHGEPVWRLHGCARTLLPPERPAEGVWRLAGPRHATADDRRPRPRRPRSRRRATDAGRRPGLRPGQPGALASVRRPSWGRDRVYTRVWETRGSPPIGAAAGRRCVTRRGERGRRDDDRSEHAPQASSSLHAAGYRQDLYSNAGGYPDKGRFNPRGRDGSKAVLDRRRTRPTPGAIGAFGRLDSRTGERSRPACVVGSKRFYI